MLDGAVLVYRYDRVEDSASVCAAGLPLFPGGSVVGGVFHSSWWFLCMTGKKHDAGGFVFLSAVEAERGVEDSAEGEGEG